MKIKTSTKLLSILLFSLIAVFASCSSNDDNDAPTEELSNVVMQDFVKDFQALSVPSGLSNSSNQYAQQANAQFNAIKSLGSSFAALFVVPANATSAKSTLDKVAAKSAVIATQTYTWSSGGTSVEYIISEESDRYTFTYNVTSTSFTGKFMDGYQLKDGSYAEAKIYSNNVVISTIKWWINGDSAKVELDSQGIKMVLTSNSVDNSGTLDLFEGTFLFAKYTWNADGSGTYVDYTSNQTFTW